jgi:hypothetical protein
VERLENVSIYLNCCPIYSLPLSRISSFRSDSPTANIDDCSTVCFLDGAGEDLAALKMTSQVEIDQMKQEFNGKEKDFKVGIKN